VVNGVFHISLPVVPADGLSTDLFGDAAADSRATISLRAAEVSSGGRAATTLSTSGPPMSPACPRPFIAGDENRLAAVAIAALSVDRPTPYNPLVLHGPSGTGKTHLAGGLGMDHQRRHPADRVVYVSGSDFARDYADAVDRHSVDQFRRGYRTARMLVIDGLEGLFGKAPAQGELLRTIDELLDQDARIVATARQAPALLTGSPSNGLSAGLRGRLSAGLCVPLALPGMAARLELLEHFARERGLELPKSVARILAEGLRTTAAELHGALVSLSFVGHQTVARPPVPHSAVARGWATEDRNSAGKQTTSGPADATSTPGIRCPATGHNDRAVHIDVATARRFVAEREATWRVGLSKITSHTARHFGLTMADLKGPSRRRGVVQARGVAMHLARQLTVKSLEQIGSYLGGRDHTTILHGCRQTEKLLEQDPATLQAVATLRRRLSQPGR
jgi:chromosomal replication initiator protein